MYDNRTRYTGYYSDNNTVLHITGLSMDDTPYICFGGFLDNLKGKNITVYSDNSNIGFTVKTFTISYRTTSGYPFYNLDGTYLGTSVLGILVKQSGISRGTYNLILSLNGDKKSGLKLTIIKHF